MNRWMHDATDMDLLRQYADGNSDAAFAALVSRHVDLVYSAALRKTGNPHAAEEITQAVFIILAQKAGRILDKTILPGWLYQTARLTASSYLRRETRRVRREQEAFMQTEPQTVAPDETWEQLAPLLEDAMGQLGDNDRAAVVLRFFGGKSFAEVATAAGVSENAAKKRVGHALEKLHHYFARRGVSSTTATIAGVLSANSVQAAPVALAKSVTAIAVTKGAAAGASTLTLIKGALKLMAWTKAKTAIVTGLGMVLAAGTITLAVSEIVPHQTSSGNPVEMKVRWMAGKTYAMRVERVETVETKASNQPQPMKQLVNLTQDYNLSACEKPGNGGWQLQLEFTGETMDVNQGGRKVSSFDSKQDLARDASNPLARMLRKLIDTRIQYVTDADGRVEKVEGVEELMRQIGTIGSPQDRALFKQMFSGDILKEYASFAAMMPDRKVAIGDRWQEQREFVSPVGILTRSDMEYTFKNREQHRDRQCLHIEIAGSISSKTDAAAQNSPYRIKPGKIAGDAWFDPELGMVVDATYDQNLAVEIMNRGQTVTLKLTQKIRLTLMDVE